MQYIYNCFNKSQAIFSVDLRLVCHKFRALKRNAVYNCFKSQVIFSVDLHLVCYACRAPKKEAQCCVYNCFNKSRAMFSVVLRLVCYTCRVQSTMRSIYNCFKSRAIFSVDLRLVCYTCSAVRKKE